MSSIPGAGPIRKGHELDTEALESYLRSNVVGFGAKIVEILQFKSGQSNPSFYLKDDLGHEYVLRKKPPGTILPSAHAIEREYKVLSCLNGSSVPVPQVYCLCEDSSVIGTAFYVMKYVSGRMFHDFKLPTYSPQQRAQIYDEMARILACIHNVDLAKSGLMSFGHAKGYFQRQISRWSEQYKKSKTHEIEAMDKVTKWLETHVPTNEETTLIHGDFRLDNMIWHPTENKVIAVLDWELSTLGNPYSDVGHNCMPYLLPDLGKEGNSAFSGFGDIDFDKHGIPSLEKYLELYCHHRKCPPIQNFVFYQVFSLFKAAAILQGVFKRSQLGNASAPNASIVGAFAEHLANFAWNLASNTTNQLNSKTVVKKEIQSGRNSTGQDALESMFPLSKKYYEMKEKLLKFMDECVYPAEAKYHQQESEIGSKWKVIPILEELKEQAKQRGLWNLFIPSHPELGAGLTNLEYAPLCEIMGRSILIAPDATNCAAPDTGNMEVLIRYGSDEQKKKWLEPLLSGEIRSGFAMTEPAVASSDATNISTEIIKDGDSYVINGRKWWTSGAGHPNCKILIVMGKTDPKAPQHRQQSMILVPIDTPGVKVIRPLKVFGYDDAPHGHMEIAFENVRVGKENMLVGEGKGFEIAQGRLGPGRIHHCMRLIGLAERCLEDGVKRVLSRSAFGKPIAFNGMTMNSIAMCRIEIEQARLLTMKAAYAMDTVGNKVAKDLIAMIKIVAPRMACNVIDRVIQMYGAAGVSQDFFVARAYAFARTLRIADGPDEVHILQLAKLEYMKQKKSKL